MAADTMLGSETEGAAPAGMEIPVSADGLAIDGETPEVGDVVDFNVSGKVSRVEGDTVYVAVTQANGSPLPAGPPPPPAVDDEAALREMAMGEDKYF